MPVLLTATRTARDEQEEDSRLLLASSSAGGEGKLLRRHPRSTLFIFASEGSGERNEAPEMVYLNNC